jgi:hypothetical protein
MALTKVMASEGGEHKILVGIVHHRHRHQC